MNPEIKQKWVAALRSGEYKQTTGHLRDETGFCCLGVLCDLHAKENNGQWEDGHYLSTKDVLPDTVEKWAGVLGPSPEVMEDDDKKSMLSELNDGGMTFARIADLIEEQL
jgi:hypothetical protein